MVSNLNATDYSSIKRPDRSAKQDRPSQQGQEGVFTESAGRLISRPKPDIATATEVARIDSAPVLAFCGCIIKRGQFLVLLKVLEQHW